MVRIDIDERSGFCTGVVKAIDKAEEFLSSHDNLYSLGDIVHNGSEIERLEGLGMKTIGREALAGLSNVDVLFRAHGEPPSTYALAKANNIRLIDATCPVVSGLQREQIYKIQAEYAPQLKELESKLAALKKEQAGKIEALLSPEQKKKLEEIKAAATAAAAAKRKRAAASEKEKPEGAP